jgi:hypothetical protein
VPRSRDGQSAEKGSPRLSQWIKPCEKNPYIGLFA